MEFLFAHTYLLIFGKLAAGGLLSLAVPSFSEMERGFYKSTGVIYLLCAYVMAGGELSLYWDSRTQVVSGLGAAAWCGFAAAFTVYCISLYTDYVRLRARSFTLGVFMGFAAVAITAAGYVRADASWASALPYILSAVVGAALTGGASSGMFLGHWYLIDTGLDLAPLHRMLGFCRNALRLHVAVVLLGALSLAALGGAELRETFAPAISGDYVWLSAGRVFAWALSFLLLELIRRTLAIPQTMAATGLFYIAALVVAVGEILGQWLLFRTGLPL